MPTLFVLVMVVALVYRRSRHNLNRQYLQRTQEFERQRRSALLDPVVAAAIGDNKEPRNPLHQTLLSQSLPRYQQDLASHPGRDMKNLEKEEIVLERLHQKRLERWIG